MIWVIRTIAELLELEEYEGIFIFMEMMKSWEGIAGMPHDS